MTIAGPAPSPAAARMRRHAKPAIPSTGSWEGLRIFLILLVRTAGLEPAFPKGKQILSLIRNVSVRFREPPRFSYTIDTQGISLAVHFPLLPGVGYRMVARVVASTVLSDSDWQPDWQPREAPDGKGDKAHG